MDLCNICLENVTKKFNPPNRPQSCQCGFVVHEDCYSTWLSKSDMAYNCIICHKKVRAVTNYSDVKTDVTERFPAVYIMFKTLVVMFIIMYVSTFLPYLLQGLFRSIAFAAMYAFGMPTIVTAFNIPLPSYLHSIAILLFITAAIYAVFPPAFVYQA